ncbi:MAG: hypothetical protein ABR603_07965 [Pyrinomonadaceae bacterium]
MGTERIGLTSRASLAACVCLAAFACLTACGGGGATQTKVSD